MIRSSCSPFCTWPITSACRCPHGSPGQICVPLCSACMRDSSSGAVLATSADRPLHFTKNIDQPLFCPLSAPHALPQPCPPQCPTARAPQRPQSPGPGRPTALIRPLPFAPSPALLICPCQALFSPWLSVCLSVSIPLFVSFSASCLSQHLIYCKIDIITMLKDIFKGEPFARGSTRAQRLRSCVHVLSSPGW